MNPSRLSSVGITIFTAGQVGVAAVALLGVGGWLRLALGACVFAVGVGMLAYQRAMWKRVFQLHDVLDGVQAEHGATQRELLRARFDLLATTRHGPGEGSARDE